MRSTPSRRRSLAQLAALLDELGADVLRTGKSLRVAGGVLKLARREAATMYDPQRAKYRRLPATKRLVWRGPVRR